jgi:hypothetical protein
MDLHSFYKVIIFVVISVCLTILICSFYFFKRFKCTCVYMWCECMGFANMTKLHNVENVVDVIIIVKSYVLHIKTLSYISCHFTLWSTCILNRFYWNFVILKICDVIEDPQLESSSRFKNNYKEKFQRLY